MRLQHDMLRRICSILRRSAGSGRGDVLCIALRTSRISRRTAGTSVLQTAHRRPSIPRSVGRPQHTLNNTGGMRCRCPYRAWRRHSPGMSWRKPDRRLGRSGSLRSVWSSVLSSRGLDRDRFLEQSLGKCYAPVAHDGDMATKMLESSSFRFGFCTWLLVCYCRYHDLVRTGIIDDDYALRCDL